MPTSISHMGCAVSCDQKGWASKQSWLDRLLLGKPRSHKAYVGKAAAQYPPEVIGVKLGSAPGFYGASCNGILTYDPAWIFTSSAFSTVPHLTLFFDNRTWRSHLIWVIYVLVVASISAVSNRFPAEELREPLKEINGEFRFLTAVVLGAFIGRAVGAWKERRKNYASLCGTSRALVVTLATYLPMPPLTPPQQQGGGANEARRVLRQRLGRYVVLALELAMLKARGVMDAEEAREYLTRESLLSEGEWQAMQPGDRHTTVLWWVSLEAKQLADAGEMSERGLAEISEAVLTMRANANDLMSSLDRDLPYPYASVVGALVNFVIFLQSSKLGLDARIRYMEDVPGEEGVRRFVPNSSIWGLELFVLFTFNIALHGLYNIHTVLHNPFGPRHIDVAHEVIAGGIRKLMVGLMDANERLPPSMLPEHMRAQQMPAAHQPSPMNGGSVEWAPPPPTNDGRGAAPPPPPMNYEYVAVPHPGTTSTYGGPPPPPPSALQPPPPPPPRW